MGPGHHVWELYGHNMIRVQDPATGLDVAYNFGIFDFAQKNFFWNFLQGRMWYGIQAWSTQGALAGYLGRGGSVEEQVLDLTPEEARSLAADLATLVLPGHNRYRYDPYLDNCSTRVRDALDRAVGGAIHRELGPLHADQTHRSMTADLVAGRPLLYFGLMLALGPAADEPLTAWSASFIPMYFADQVALLAVRDGAGRERKLVSGGEYFAPRARDDGAPGNPGALVPWFLGSGLLLAALLSWAGARAGGGKGRWAFVTLGGLWSLLSGLAGFVLVYLWAFTDHAVAYRNENVLQASALGLALFGALAAWARGRRAGRAVRVLAYTIVALSLCGVALKFVPGPNQVNGVALAFFLPANLGMALAARLAAPPVTT